MLILSLIYFIMSNAVATSKNIGILYSRSTNIIYLLSLIFIYYLADWHFFEKSIGIYNGLFYYNITNILFIFFLLLTSIFILLLTSFFPNETLSDFSFNVSKKNKESIFFSVTKGLNGTNNKENLPYKLDILQTKRDHFSIIEYSLIIQFILLGSISLLSSNDLITIFLSIELQSYGLYILSTIYRNSESSTSAGLTYFLLGGLSSCIILLGQSFLYINTGTTSLDALYLIHTIVTSDANLFSYFVDLNADTNVNNLHIFNIAFYQYSIEFSLIIFAVGFLFKISAAPFHSWSPGVYDAIPTVTTTFVAIIPKISILILLFDIVYSTWYSTFNYTWTSILLLSSFLSLILGSVLGLSQFKLKRLYAYSTISHVGFILLALSIHNVESIQAFFFYLIQYSLSNLNAFLLLISIGYTSINLKKKTKAYESISYIYVYYEKLISNLSPIQYIDQLKGYFYLNPFIAISLAITLYSFIGVPPLVGFFAKQMILSSALDNGYVFMSLVAILTSVVSAVYYLYIVKHMFFEKSTYTVNNTLLAIKNSQLNNDDTLTLSSWLSCIISILTLLILSFIFLYYEIYFLTSLISIIIVY